ncbi:MAG: S1 RNA-binding domain-containing protein [Clostridia bacterium]|nr:S1 RNA-binding domain-containing protein [Clostridia bacterium]
MQLEVGTIVEGKVTGFTSFGAFIDLGEGKKGLVHISEVASDYVKEISDHLTVGQDVKVKVISIGDDGKISLSIKRVNEEKKAQQPRQPRQQRSSRPANVWQGTAKSTDNQHASFEDMMAKFKQVSDEKMSDLKRDSKHGGGYNRRGTNKI